MDAEAINAVIIQLSPDGHGDIKYAHRVIRNAREEEWMEVFGRIQHPVY